MSRTADVVVVGSGAGGGRVALDLTRAGARVVVLEAGPRWEARELPLPEVEMLGRMYWNAGLELSTDASIIFTRGRGVGGSTIVNQALLDQFDEEVFARWRTTSGVPLFSTGQMAPWYAHALRDLQVATIGPARFNANSAQVARAFSQHGITWHGLRRGEGPECQTADCMRCLGGCPHESKQSSAVTTLREASRRGAVVHAGWTVQRLVERGPCVDVEAVGVEGTRTWQAGLVVLAAGSLGTPQVLWRSGWKRDLPRLGEGFTCHPQFLTGAVLPVRVDAHRGAFQGVASSDPRYLARGYKFESNFVPPIVFHTLFQQRPGHDLAERYRRMVGVEICLRDLAPGRLRLDRSGRLRVERALSREERDRWGEATAVLRDCYKQLGATEMMFSPKAFSVHPMGGCAMGADPTRGVVDPDFRVFGHPRVAVCDGSLFPAAPGRNPSLTIMALAGAAADQLRKAA